MQALVEAREAYEAIKEDYQAVLAPERDEVMLLGGLHVIGPPPEGSKTAGESAPRLQLRRRRRLRLTVAAAAAAADANAARRLPGG